MKTDWPSDNTPVLLFSNLEENNYQHFPSLFDLHDFLKLIQLRSGSCLRSMIEWLRLTLHHKPTLRTLRREL